MSQSIFVTKRDGNREPLDLDNDSPVSLVGR